MGEVMVDRIVKHEVTMGHFKRPMLPSEAPAQEAKNTTRAKKGSLVDEIIADDADRKEQLEKQK